ncbi:MAG: LamG-like jellyroll fold domain-containing protein [Chitinophagaceae bacterium]
MKKIILLFVFIYTTNIYAQFTPGESILFDGVNEHILTSFTGVSGANPRTIEAWVKPALYTGVPTSAEQRVLWDMGATSPNGSRFTSAIQWAPRNFRTEAGGNGNQGAASLNDLKWHHVAVTFDPTATNKVTTYVDGNLDWNGNFTVTVNTSTTSSFRLGVRVDGINYYSGEMDEVRFWNYVRTPAQIKEGMHKPVDPLSTGLITYFSFDGATNTAAGVSNLSNFGFPGTMTNMESTDIITSQAPIHWDATMNEVHAIWSLLNIGNESGGSYAYSASALASGTYLAYGHNNGSGSHITADVPTGVDERYDRVWSLDGLNSPVATLNFDLSTIEATSVVPSSIGNYVLLYRASNAGTFTNLTTASAIVNSDQVEFQNIAIQDGYYTVGFITAPVLLGGNAITNQANPICAGTPFTVLLSGSSNLSGQTYQWYESTDNITYTPILNATNNSFNNAGITSPMYYRCEITLGLNTVQSIPLYMNVNALPIITISSNPSNATVCNGDIVTLSGNGATTYIWNGGITDNTPFQPSISSAYTVEGTDAQGCTNTNSIFVTVNSLPNVSASASTTSICENATLELFESGNATLYNWSNVGVSSNTPFAISSSTTYTLVGTDANNCTASATIFIQVNPSNSVITNASALNASSISGISSAIENQLLNTSLHYYTGNCNLAATISNNALAMGSTTVDVHVESTTPIHNTQPYVARWFSIIPTNNSSADVALYLTQDDFDQYNTYASSNAWPLLPQNPSDVQGINNLRITKNDNAGLGVNPIVIIPSNVQWDIANAYWIVSFSTPSFSQFRLHAVNINNIPLPANTLQVSAQKMDAQDLILWSEKNLNQINHFDILYSTDGIAYTTLHSEIANASTTQYSFVHTKPLPGNNFYKLVEKDFENREIAQSKIFNLYRNNAQSTITCFPNPVHHDLVLSIHDNQNKKYNVVIIDAVGKTLLSTDINSTSTSKTKHLDVSALPSGIYFIQVTQNQKIIYNQKITKF